MARPRYTARRRGDVRGVIEPSTSSASSARRQHNHLLIGRCVRWYRHEAADLTVQDRTYVWRALANWLEEHHETTLDEASSEQLQEWRQGQDCCRRTLAKKVSAVHTFYYWLTEIEEARPDDPSRKIQRPRRVKRDSDVVSKAMTEREFFLALEAATFDLELFAMLMLGRFCGLRRVEMARLRVADVEPRPEGGAWLAVHGKGDQWRRVPCEAAVYAAIRPFLVGRGYLFFRATANERTRVRKTSRKVNEHLHALGIGHVLHDTRHSCATRLLELTGNLREVQELLGHASPDTTALYTTVEPGQLAGVVDLATRQSLSTHAPALAQRTEGEQAS